jgi:hypothetical protein
MEMQEHEKYYKNETELVNMDSSTINTNKESSVADTNIWIPGILF